MVTPTRSKEKLQPAIDELEGIGFLKPLSQGRRYKRLDRGQWLIQLSRGSSAITGAPQLAMEQPIVPELSPLVAELTKRGVTKATAEEMVRNYPAEAIDAKLDVFDWLVEKQDKRVGRSPAGYLMMSIQKDYATPKGFVPKAERVRREQAHLAKDRQAAEERRRKQEAERRQNEDDAQIARLTPGQRVALEAELLTRADPDTRRNYENPITASFRETLMLMMLREHFREKRKVDSVPAQT